MIYVAVNMLVCAVLFFPWAKPRETVSGLFGRWAATGSRAGRAAAAVIDICHWWEPDHCVSVAEQEAQAREVLYGP